MSSRGGGVGCELPSLLGLPMTNKMSEFDEISDMHLKPSLTMKESALLLVNPTVPKTIGIEEPQIREKRAPSTIR
ncbi:hypothetical protein AVEN_87246-1 [Araneus ventricosus]|uniref:Uncharacterized protein n=1 Tax=Araneus ventricosus TaxID=182803 RepID=A0A4Y2TEW4_ARAVE|nr:hypothetical protein AVEN_87246-1 [Araneus ventricosus]